MLRDGSGAEQSAQLSYVSPQQINLLLPGTMTTGNAVLTVTGSAGMSHQVPLQVTPVAPGLFTANSSGNGVPAATALLTMNTGGTVPISVFTCGTVSGTCTNAPIALPAGGDRLFLTLYGTGIRNRRNLSDVTVHIGGTPVPVIYAGAQAEFPGLDQVNLEIPANLTTRGLTPLVLSIAGRSANPVQLLIE
jgi:uncharacterized protein (TIGR03437 family)